MRHTAVEQQLLASLPLVERLAISACRGSRMTPADIEDFVAEVKLKLVEDDYAALRKFEGRCSLPTYLAMIVKRQLLDHRAHTLGRFRPSAKAQQMGAHAVRLEKLVVRDGRPLDEALELLRRSGEPMSRAEGERIAEALPRRAPKATTAPLDEVAEPPATDADPLEAVAAREREVAARTVGATLRQAIAELPTADQAVFQLHFVAGLSIAEIARMMGTEQQPLYRRIRRHCLQLRGRLIEAGLDAERVGDLVGRPETDLDLGLDAIAPEAVQP